MPTELLTMTIRILKESSTEPEHYFVAEEKLIAGNPRQTVWMQYTDPTSKFFAGTWASDIGKWKIRYTEEEECLMLEGTCVVTDTQGHAVTLTQGDRFVIPRGFEGTWEVVTPAKKTFVVYEPGEPVQP